MTKDEKVELYNKLVASHTDAVRKGATIPYTSINGNMCSMFTKDDYLGLRLPAGERERFIDKYKTGLVQQYGIVQKEYVVVPEDLLKNTEKLQPWFNMSFEYASRLRPKPTAKPKKTI